MNFSKVLVANRGEIAVRIIHALKELSIRTVAVYSEADESSLHVALADEAVKIGPAKPQDSYLNYGRVLSAATSHGVDAIHPGYGFLSENPSFAVMCLEEGIEFIGPGPDAIGAAGDKVEAKRRMEEAGVPVVSGSDGVLSDVREAKSVADRVGYPVLLKARAGGGGRGMRVVNTAGDIENAYNTASNEALTAFGDGVLYLERLLENPRHVEVQVVADRLGNVVHLFERECSIQRRHQKILEEAPSPDITPEMRERMGSAAVRGARAMGYDSVGTLEFLVEGEKFYFCEMNARVQVEHPITEEITGTDIVKSQILIAEGHALEVTQEDIPLLGCAVEARINAEDTERDFAPTPGTITSFRPPGGIGVRVDTHVYSGYRVPPYYDSLIAKVITRGHDRDEALARLARALSEMEIEGVPTTIPFHLSLLESDDFRSGRYDLGLSAKI